MKHKTTPDPLIDEVRSIRRALDEASGHDLHKLAELARKAGQEYRNRRKPIAGGRKSSAQAPALHQ